MQTTPVDPAVLDAMLPYLRDNFGNAGSVHTPGSERGPELTQLANRWRR